MLISKQSKYHRWLIYENKCYVQGKISLKNVIATKMSIKILNKFVSIN